MRTATALVVLSGGDLFLNMNIQYIYIHTRIHTVHMLIGFEIDLPTCTHIYIYMYIYAHVL